MILCVEGHRTAERRSLAYHRWVAERIGRDPSLVEAARARVDAWRDVHPPYVEAWRQILMRPPAQIAASLVDESEYMTMLRQVSPFAGALDARTRWQIWRSVA